MEDKSWTEGIHERLADRVIFRQVFKIIIIINLIGFILNNKYNEGCEPADHKLHRGSFC